MIRICKLEEGADITYDYVRCPSCGKGRLCDKPRGTKVAVLRIEGMVLDISWLLNSNRHKIS